MECYHPLSAWRAIAAPHGSKRSLVFDASKGYGPELQLPCGQCIGCRLEHARQWAVRIMHEASLHERTAFLTLTYDEDNLPMYGSLVPEHHQKFMKDLRARLEPERVRFFACGEYGEKFSRPHYHSCLFGFDFPDKVFFKESEGGRLWRSPFLDQVWSRGSCLIGDLCFESAAYVAGYVTKKVTGEAAYDHYWRLDERTGECFQIEPEFCVMSRRPGIASRWYQQFGHEVRKHDDVIVRGHPAKPPRYYDKLHEAVDSASFERVKVERERERLKRDRAEAHWVRRMVRERVAKGRAEVFARRRYEGGSGGTAC